MANRIVKIGVAGYKSAMSPIAVNLRDITVLAGPNSAGKSTVIQPLLMIKQTLEKPFDPGGLAIDGPLVRFTRAEQFLSEPGDLELRRLTVEFASSWHEFTITYRRSPEGLVVPEQMQFFRDGRRFTWRLGETLPAEDESLGPLFAALQRSGQADLPAEPGPLTIVQAGCWLAAKFATDPPSQNNWFGGYSPVRAEAWPLLAMIHLPGLRKGPERDYPLTGLGPGAPGDFVAYVGSIIHAWSREGNGRIESIAGDLRRLGLTSRIAAVRRDDTRIELQVARLPDETSEMVNIADVGLGVGQVLPVLVALHAAERDRIVHIEQPELHLHPRAQVELAGILLDAADRGVQVVIETHSSLLLLALQTLVAEGKLKPDQLSLNWFTRDAQGQTCVKEAKITEDGAYGKWPADFGAIEFEAQSHYLDAVSRRRKAKRSAA